MTEIHLNLNDLLTLIREKGIEIKNPGDTPWAYEIILHDKLPFPDHEKIKKKRPFREPCDWWFHRGFIEDKDGNRVPGGPFYCANKESSNYDGYFCPRQTCPNYAITRDEKKPKVKTCVNCVDYESRGDSTTCYSCIKNPQTQIEDNWRESK